MLATKITKDQYASLDDNLKDEYKLNTDGSYSRVLLEKIDKLKSQLTELNDNHNTQTTEYNQQKTDSANKITDLENKISALESEKGTNYSEMKSFWEDRVSNVTDQAKKDIDSFKGKIKETLKDIKAKSISDEIAVDGGAELLTPHLKNKIDVDIADSGEIAFKFLDNKGKVSFADQNEFIEDVKKLPNLALAIKGNKSSGSGGGDGDEITGDVEIPKDKTVLDMTMSQKLAYYKAKRQA